MKKCWCICYTRTSTNITKTFASSDFAFTDADTSDSSLSAIKIVTLPSSGTLTLSGSAVSADDEIAVASISSLVYTPHNLKAMIALLLKYLMAQHLVQQVIQYQ